MKSLKLKLITGLLASVGTLSASAATVTLSGTSFDVSYDDALVGLFGTPALIGDTLQWFPSGSPGFSALNSRSLTGIDFVNSTFALTIQAKQGYKLTGFNLSEGGDYVFFGNTAGVSASGQLRVTPLDPLGGTLTSAIVPTAAFVGNLPFDFNTHNWTANAAVTLASNAGKANVSIQNLLAAYAAPNEFPAHAFIEKKEVSLWVGVIPIPEPESYALFLAGLGMVGFIARRRLTK